MVNPHALVFGIMINPTRENIAGITVDVLRYLVGREQRCIIETEHAALLEAEGYPAANYETATRQEIAEKSSVIITYGGDGTLLTVAQYSLQYDVPVLGVNLGKLGFLADIRPAEVIGAIEHIMDDQYVVERRMTLQGRLEGKTETFFSLNDIVVSKSGSTKVIEIDAFINGEYLATFFADGFIVSTPTGSTAYSLATGGPIVVPGCEAIVLSPISAHALTARPMIIPSSCRIQLKTRSTDGVAMVMTDGVVIAENLRNLTLHIEKSQQYVKLVKGIGPSYYTMLREKLNWATDARKSKKTSSDV